MAQEWWYRLSPDDVVIGVGPGWDEFALQNDGDGAVSDRVVGRSLFDFIDGSSTRELLRSLLQRTRARERRTELSFHCDAPHARRSMSWSAEREPDGSLLVRTRILEEGPRDPVPFMDRTVPRSTEVIRMCSWCNRIAADPEGWVEPETAAARLGLFTEREVPDITHGICPSCTAAVTGEAEAGGMATP